MRKFELNKYPVQLAYAMVRTFISYLMMPQTFLFLLVFQRGNTRTAAGLNVRTVF